MKRFRKLKNNHKFYILKHSVMADVIMDQEKYVYEIVKGTIGYLSLTDGTDILAGIYREKLEIDGKKVWVLTDLLSGQILFYSRRKLLRSKKNFIKYISSWNFVENLTCDLNNPRAAKIRTNLIMNSPNSNWIHMQILLGGKRNEKKDKG